MILFFPKIGACLLILVAYAINACSWATPTQIAPISHCRELDDKIDLSHRIETLNYLSSGFFLGCYEEVIRHGTMAQSKYKYKTFSLTKETTELFLPEGTATDYVMESYERGYLSFMIAISYLNLGKDQSSAVELRKLNHELGSELYNYGEDSINLLFQAVLWHRLGFLGDSRVDWYRLEQDDALEDPFRSFASSQVRSIDTGHGKDLKWEVYALGQFPEITWDMKFLNSQNGYFSVKPVEPFISGCVSPTGIRISTKKWFHKIAIRHAAGYHPLINVKSWIRLPIGMAYGITVISSGAAIIISGCAIDAYAGGNGSFCQIAVEGGAALISESANVVHESLKPDLRHWSLIPEAFLFTTSGSVDQEACYPGLLYQRTTRRVL